MHGRRVADVVSAHGRGQHLQQQACACMEQGQHVGYWKAAPFCLCGRLAEMSSQTRPVRHGKVGTVQRPGAMSAPTARRLDLGKQSVANVRQQLFEQCQGQPLAGRTISRGAERNTGQTRQRRARCIAMKDLQQKYMHSIRGAENPVTADVSQEIADPENHWRRDCLRHIDLELTQNFGDSEGHPWPPVGKGCRHSHSDRRSLFFRDHLQRKGRKRRDLSLS